MLSLICSYDGRESWKQFFLKLQAERLNRIVVQFSITRECQDV